MERNLKRKARDGTPLFDDTDNSVQCAKTTYDEKNSREWKLLEYTKIVKDLDVELVSPEGDLKIEFHERFSAIDIHRLALAFRNDADPPGEGANIWPVWASRYPQHTTVEWATYFHFWVALLFRSSLLNLDRKRLVVETQLPDNFLSRFSGEDIRQLVAFDRTVRPDDESQDLILWANFVQTHPKHREEDWAQLWSAWFRPMINSQQALMPLDQPADVEIGKGKANRGRNNPFRQENAGIWNKQGPLTLLAERYGPSVHFYFHNSGDTGNTPRRSGLTPRHQPIGHAALTPFTYAHEKEYEEYQKSVLGGMSLMELYDLEVVEKPNLLPHSLTNPIHPIFERDRWHKVKDDHWDLQADDYAWEALLPCLRLASRFLIDSHLETWWDDLIHAAQSAVIIPGTPYFRYFTRNAEVRFREKTDWTFVEPRLSLFVGYAGRGVSAFTESLDENKSSKDILDTGNPEDRYAGITINKRLVLVLMERGPGQLTEAEKLTHTFFVAVTLLHELAHAHGQIYFGTNRMIDLKDVVSQETMRIRIPEPFYDKEDFAELGYSMELAIFGGVLSQSVEDPREMNLKRFKYSAPGIAEPLDMEENIPSISLLIRPTPTFEDFELVYSRIPTLNPDQWTQGPQSFGFSHVPLSFIEEIQQDNFWEVYTRELGGGMLNVYPIIRKIFKFRSYAGAITKSIFTTLDYKRLEWERLGLHQPQNEPPHILSMPYFDIRLKKASAIALRVILRQEEILRHNRIRLRLETPAKRAQVEQYEARRQQEFAAFEEARHGIWSLEEVQDIANKHVAAIIDAIPDLPTKFLLCDQNIATAERERSDSTSADNLRAAWNTQYFAYSKVRSDLEAAEAHSGIGGSSFDSDSDE